MLIIISDRLVAAAAAAARLGAVSDRTPRTARRRDALTALGHESWISAMGAPAPDPSLTERGQLVESLLGALDGADQRSAMRVVDRAITLGWTIDDVRLHLVTPALYEVGRRWQRAEIGVADEHLACSICEWLLFALAGRVRRPPATGRRALVGCSEGELHSLGARMIAHLLSERGWTVLLLGADTPASAWPQIVRARRPDVALLSTTTHELLAQVGPSITAIKSARPDCHTVVGGQAFRGLQSAASDFGADSVLLDARALIQQSA